MIGGGQYFIDPKELYKFRTKIDSKAQELREILADPRFIKLYSKLKGEKLKTCPKGFEKTDPNLDLLVNKSFFSYYNINILNKTDSEIKKEILKGFLVIFPLVDFLRKINI